MSVKTTSYRDSLNRKLEGAFAETCKAYETRIHQVIRLKRDWNNPPGFFGRTRRRNKTIVIGNYRTIYDLGTLDRSLVPIQPQNLRCRYHWTARYAGYVHEGTAGGRRAAPIPARKFTEVAARLENLPSRFANEYKKIS